MTTPLEDRLATAMPYWDAYWAGETPMLIGTAPKPGMEPVAKPPWGAIFHMDREELADRLLGWVDSHVFSGGAVPGYCVSLHTGFNATILGADLERCGDSHRPVPCIRDLQTVTLRLQEECADWQLFVDTARFLKEHCGDKILISAPTLGVNLDTLDALMGTTELLFALVDQPEAVCAALEQIDAVHEQLVRVCDELFEVPRLGSVNRHDMVCRGRTAIPQCDFSCMIGPERFREVALPFIRKEMQRLDGVEYHLDGPDAIRHLEALCETPELHLIQWVPGAGNEGTDWGWLFQRIDDLGKGQLRGGSVSAFEQTAAGLRSSHLFWNAGASDPQQVCGSVRSLGWEC